MCGICGEYIFDITQKIDQSFIEQMCSLIRHRGPDDEGLYIKDNIGLGHRRLSIIDLSTGHQPIFNEDQSIAIVFNGEIYNFKELRKTLEAKGHLFKTNTDTEVIVHLYEEKAEQMLNDLRGMFAIAIWDQRNQKLFLARDRVGKKPLYYAIVDNSLIFSSEMKSLLLKKEISRELNYNSIDDFLAYQYIPAPNTIFKNINKLEAGTYLTCQNGKIEKKKYWELDYEPKMNISLKDAKDEFINLFNDAVKCRLESDVPLGCFLSGGIDSSAVVAFMRKNITDKIRTFSIGFEEEEFNELPYARMIADKFQTDHTEFIVKPNAVDVLPKLVWHFDEPYADYSAIPTYYLAQVTKQHVSVALNGDGGDESFAGYKRYIGLDIINKFKKIPISLRKNFIKNTLSILKNILPNINALESLNYLNDISLYDDEHLYIQMLLIFKRHFRENVFSSDFRNIIEKNNCEEKLIAIMNDGKAKNLIDKKLHVDVQTYLSGDLLPKIDRTTMAFGLEGRSPFLDQNLMQWAAKLPENIKFKDNILKYFLKESLRGILPDEILFRQKHGFSVPLGKWFSNELNDFAKDILLSEKFRSRGIFNTKYVENLLKWHSKSGMSHHHRIWALLCFEIWCRTFLDNDFSKGPIN